MGEFQWMRSTQESVVIEQMADEALRDTPSIRHVVIVKRHDGDMMHVHVNGRGIAGVYPWEVADTKCEAVISLARESGFPLQAVTEEA